MPDVLDVGEQLAALSRDGHADITEDLEVLVFWSPARHSNAPAAG